VRRHAIQHAVDAGRLDELIPLDPDALERAFNTAATTAGRRSATVYQQSLVQYRSSKPQARRDVLAINATRYGATELVDRLASVPGLRAPRYWRPRWATGGQLHAPYIAIMTGHTGAVTEVNCMTLAGRPVAVTGSKDGTCGSGTWFRAGPTAGSSPCTPSRCAPSRVPRCPGARGRHRRRERHGPGVGPDERPPPAPTRRPATKARWRPSRVPRSTAARSRAGARRPGTGSWRHGAAHPGPVAQCCDCAPLV
jgi:hypothetical protein